MSDEQYIDPYGIPYTLEQLEDTADIFAFVQKLAADAFDREIQHDIWLPPETPRRCADCDRDMSTENRWAYRWAPGLFELLCTSCAYPDVSDSD